MAEHEAAAAQHAAELEALGQHAAAVEAEYGALRAEYHAVTDDLAALVKENQVRWGALRCGRERCEQARLWQRRAPYRAPLSLAPRPVQVISDQLASITAERQELADQVGAWGARSGGSLVALAAAAAFCVCAPTPDRVAPASVVPQVKLHSTRCHYSEQLARAREADVSGGWEQLHGRRPGAWRATKLEEAVTLIRHERSIHILLGACRAAHRVRGPCA